MGRPVGVTILAILDFIGAAFCLLGGIGMILGGGFIATMMSQQGGQGSAGAAGFFAGLGAVAGVFIIIIGGVCALVGFGLWKLKGWARIVSIVLAGIGGAFQLLGLLGSLAHFNLFAVVWSLFWIAVNALIIWYLLKPKKGGISSALLCLFNSLSRGPRQPAARWKDQGTVCERHRLRDDGSRRC